MSRNSTTVAAMLLAVLSMMPAAWAQRPPETHPADEDRHIAMDWDRSSMPGDIALWAPRVVLGYEPQGTNGYGELFLTCASSSSAVTGRCPTQDTLENSPNAVSRIPVLFTEQRSGTQVELEIVADIMRADGTPACNSGYWSGQLRPIWSSAFGTCAGRPRVGTGASMRLDSTQLQHLVAGRWTGRLELTLRKPPHQPLARHAFSFEFTVTDHDAVAIYFPAFDQITPHVGLNLHYDPVAQTIAGRALLDMCLYDGLGSQSEYLGVTVRDSGPRPPGGNGYSAWHHDGGSDASQRLDYTVTLAHAGARLPMLNNVEQQLRGIDSAQLRPVILPGMSQTVFCVPAPLTFDTPPVPINSKRPGYYGGDLQVELRLPTSRP